MNKKGQVGAVDQLGSIIVPLVVIAVVLVVGFLIMAQVKLNAEAVAPTYSTPNGSVAVTVNTFSVINTSCYSGADVSITEVWNDTILATNKAQLQEPGVGASEGGRNWTIVGREINVSDKHLGGVLGVIDAAGNVMVSYTCILPDYAINATSAVQSAQSDIPQWLVIIIIVVIGTILIGLVQVFRRRA